MSYVLIFLVDIRLSIFAIMIFIQKMFFAVSIYIR